MKPVEAREFVIPFIGLSLGVHHFKYDLTPAFFDDYPEQEFREPHLQVALSVEKKSNNTIDLFFSLQGKLKVDCDRTLKEFDLAVEAERRVLVKFADEYDNEDDEILFLPHGAYEIDVRHYIYELSVLSVPSKRLFPGLEEETDIYSTEIENESEPDPRWNGLKSLNSED